MFRNLLAERFGLKFHEESKDVHGFELVIGESGFKLTPSVADSESSSHSNAGPAPLPNMKLDQQGFPNVPSQHGWRLLADRPLGIVRASFRRSMEDLAKMLKQDYTQNTVPVIDRTELKTVFDFHLILPIPSSFDSGSSAAPMFPSGVPDDPRVGLGGISGSLEKQTGLRLKAIKVTVRTMVIDNVARTPTAN